MKELYPNSGEGLDRFIKRLIDCAPSKGTFNGVEIVLSQSNMKDNLVSALGELVITKAFNRGR